MIARQLGKQPITVPARDVLHIRLHCVDRKRPFPLKGETPLTAALMDLAAGNAIQQQQIQFYLNQARPSAVLSTDQVLDARDSAINFGRNGTSRPRGSRPAAARAARRS